ncbi:MAG: hypothetical protein ABSG07_10370 [Terriglobales bacterium]|jgi:hypothetical protein
MTRNIRRFIVMALPIVAFALTSSAAMAQSYSGNWPMTVTKSQYANGTYCVALTDDGSAGWPHSGGAVLVPETGTYPGIFQVIDGLLTVNIPAPAGANLSFLLYTARASGGHIGKGVYNLAYGGFNDSGVLVFGAKGGC